MPLGALRRAQLQLAWLCLLRLSHASRCSSWCRWDLASSCFKHESCADCDCPAGSQEGCLAWCDGHCEDPKCATCRACKEHRECDPVDRRDAKIEGCASWCSTSFSSEHCGKCSCKACDFCLALYPREDEEPEIEVGDAPPSAAAPIQMTDDLRRARWERWITAHLQERSRCCGSCARRCYAYRYSDLLVGFCNGNIEECDAGRLTEHYEQWGKSENREFYCKSQDAQCCKRTISTARCASRSCPLTATTARGRRCSS